jgi:hypothetical protein
VKQEHKRIQKGEMSVAADGATNVAMRNIVRERQTKDLA